MRNEHLSQRVFHAPALFYNKAVDKWSSLCFWWILDGNRQTYRHTKVSHCLRSPGVQQSINSKSWNWEIIFFQLSVLLKAKLISPKSYFLLDFHRIGNPKRKSRFLLSSRICINFSSIFFNIDIFLAKPQKNSGSTYISLLTLIIGDAWPASFWSSNISENFGIWRRKSVTPCWSKKNYFSGKIDGKP